MAPDTHLRTSNQRITGLLKTHMINELHSLPNCQVQRCFDVRYYSQSTGGLGFAWFLTNCFANNQLFTKQ